MGVPAVRAIPWNMSRKTNRSPNGRWLVDHGRLRPVLARANDPTELRQMIFDLCQMIFDVGLGRCDQVKDPDHGVDAEAFGQSRNGPHQFVRINLLGVKRRAHGFQELTAAAQTNTLPPASSVG